MTATSPEPTPTPTDAIAVIGMACRFPGAETPEEFWDNLRNGEESITFFEEAELRAAGVPDELISDPRYVRCGGGRLRDVAQFDAAYFGFDDSEAALLDPQHRLLLECAHEALERAGHDPAGFEGAIGIFGGVGGPHYLLHQVAANRAARQRSAGLAMSVAHEKDFATLRTAYLLDLRGPAIGVQTACSTSLVAAHLACQSLLAGECDMALAGGASVAALRTSGYLHDVDDVYSDDGHCRAFDAAATGMVGGDGAGIVVLRRLEDAIEAGDRVEAIILGSAANNDGAGKVGFVAPGVGAQRQVIEEALGVADVDPRTISYVEAHGTGTPLGDMIEVAALTDAFRASTSDRGFCGIGSVKTNIGHCNTAAGAASLIKTVLALRHGELPPTLHFAEPNPEIDFASSPFRVVTAREPWQSSGPRRAGVHAMAIGGTNAHLILQQPPPAPPAAEDAPEPELLVVSARTAEALERSIAALAAHLDATDASLADVAFTLRTGRRAHGLRRAIVAGSCTEAAAALRTLDVQTAAQVHPREVAWIANAGSAPTSAHRACHRQIDAFREAFDRAIAGFDPAVQAAARQALESTSPPSDPTTAAAVQLACECATAACWQARGVTARVVAGRGAGAVAAAHLVGALSLADAAHLCTALAGGGNALPPGLTWSTPASRWAAHDGEWMRADLWTSWPHWRAAFEAERVSVASIGASRAVICTDATPSADATSALPNGTDHEPRAAILRAAGDLWATGAEVAWNAMDRGRALRRVLLPTYPFERRRHWIDADEDLLAPTAPGAPPSDDRSTGGLRPRPAISSDYVEPAGEIQTCIATVWREVLGLERVGARDNFFEVGGRSLTGIRVMTRLRAELQVELALRQLFEAPTIAELATLVELERWDDDDSGGGDDREEIEL